MITFRQLIESLGQPRGLLDRIRAIRAMKVADLPSTPSIKSARKGPITPFDWDEFEERLKYAHHDRLHKRQLAEELLKDFGFRFLGEGVAASVWGHKNQKFVVKLFTDDIGYSKWLKYCIQNRSNPYVPVIRGKLVDAGGFHVIRIEELIRVNEREYDAFDVAYTTFMHDRRSTGDDNLDAVLTYIGHDFDLHDGNIMKRPNGQIVIIDPLAPWEI